MDNLRETPNVSDRKSNDQRPSVWMCEILMPVSGPVVAAYPISLPYKGDVASCSNHLNNLDFAKSPLPLFFAPSKDCANSPSNGEKFQRTGHNNSP